MKKILLKKNYTRDNCLIIQEVWDRAYLEDYSGKKNPYFPAIVNYVYDGVVEFWEYEKAIHWFMDRLLVKNKDDRTFLNTIVDKHAVTVQKLRTLLKRRHLDSIVELKEFIHLLESGTYTFLVFYHTAMDERTPKAMRALAMKTRKKDAFYDEADLLIRNTIEYLYPHTKNLTISILARELESPPSKDTLRKRFEHCVMIIDGTLKIVSLELFAKKHPLYRFDIPKITDRKRVKGDVACRGKVIGPVRIIKRKNQAKEFQAGEILVSPMTTPDFLPAMKKAAAIVTDEGGITCHASIVTREMKKPCVIGTKIATKVFKDGDMVEVDAIKGIVRKI